MNLSDIIQKGCFLNSSKFLVELNLLVESVKEELQSETNLNLLAGLLARKNTFGTGTYMNSMYEASMCLLCISSGKYQEHKGVLTQRFVECCSEISLCEKSKHLWLPEHHIF